MRVKRVFLDWHEPFLRNAGDYLLKHFGKNFENSIIVVPARRSGRKLLTLLVEKEIKVEPQIISVGELPELFYQPTAPTISRELSAICWARALSSISAEVLSDLANEALLSPNSYAAIAFGQALDGVWSELSAAGLGFDDVLARKDILNEHDEKRWNALARTHQAYLQILTENGFGDLHSQRKFALEKGQIGCEKEIILFAASDLNLVARNFLAQSKSRITSLIHAAEEHAHLFDEYGSLNHQAWLSEQILLSDSSMIFSHSASDLGEAIGKVISGEFFNFSPENITIGVTNPDFVPYISRGLTDASLSGRSSEGQLLTRTSPGILLSGFEKFLRSRSFRDLSALIRHPDVQSILAANPSDSSCLVSELDQFHSAFLPWKVTEELSAHLRSNQRLRDKLTEVLRLTSLFDEGRKSLLFWLSSISELIGAVFPEVDNNSIADEAVKLIKEKLLSWLSGPSELTLNVSAADAIKIFLKSISEITIPRAQDEKAIEILGWLDLQLDDAPVLIVVGVNEGYVPQSVTSDSLLPNSIRSQLGLLDNSRRYARDAYTLTAISKSRKHLRLVVSRIDPRGESLMPSRLLLADSAKIAAQRVLQSYAEENAKLNSQNSGSAVDRAYIYQPPTPQALSKPITSLSITGFKDYLYCPYRFYLRHVLGLKREDDTDEEMSPQRFGTFAHEILRQFAFSNAAQSSNYDDVLAMLNSLLERNIFEQFKNPLPAVELQLEQFRTRLSAFAKWQCSWVDEGWEIAEKELKVNPDQALLNLEDGSPFGLRGRIDRIDYNPRLGQWAIIDYKTGGTFQDPNKTHFSKKEGWIDVQLPLYWEIAKQLGIVKGPCQLGYVLLSQEVSKIGGIWAKWEEVQLNEALDTARQVAAKVKQQIFWPPRQKLRFVDDFADICGVGLLSVNGNDEQEEATL